MRLTPIKKHPNIKIELFLRTSEKGPPTKTAMANPSCRRAVSVPACKRFKLREERIAGRAVPRNVRDIPRKLIETKAPEVIIHRLSLISFSSFI
jgi:hypothetical protein